MKPLTSGKERCREIVKCAYFENRDRKCCWLFWLTSRPSPAAAERSGAGVSGGASPRYPAAMEQPNPPLWKLSAFSGWSLALSLMSARRANSFGGDGAGPALAQFSEAQKPHFRGDRGQIALTGIAAFQLTSPRDGGPTLRAWGNRARPEISPKLRRESSTTPCLPATGETTGRSSCLVPRSGWKAGMRPRTASLYCRAFIL